ncbi:acetate--CoA ligase family protein [Acidimangrovimonas sediminis]|uniref:acetate--CoA ligase family protein n=1 Tax=Acidimangrovimonas sediminis TaxID=2056283 RepID=UPI000C7FAD11|nr:acetate--CoA ligase family protein [Acidimangrovimonas sediminis]
MSRDLSRLLRPRSIAVLGGSWAANVVEQTRKMGFSGEVWPVHPAKPEIGGARAYPSVRELPGVPDATFIGVNRHATLDVVAELAAVGAGGAICFASGWREAGEAALQDRLVVAAGGMPVLGPNCYGVINYLDGALLWPDQHGGRRVERGVALLSQSSNIVINLTMQARGLPVAYVACLGNAAQVGLAELGAALLHDERVTALGLYVEGIGDAPAVAALAEAARASGKGIVALKSGKGAKAQAAAASHTAALAGGGAASAAFLAQAGMTEVATLEEMLEALKIVHVHRGLPGRRICSLSCSGGEAGLVADLAEGRALDFALPAEAQAEVLAAELGPLVTIANPLDYHTFIWGDGPRTTKVFSTMLAGYDAGLFLIDPPRPDRCDPASFRPALEAIGAAQEITGKPAFPVASLPENFDEGLAEALIARGVAPLMGLPAALGALEALALTRAPEKGWRPWPAAPERGGRVLPEGEAKARLAAAGIVVPRGVSAPTLQALGPLAADLDPPLALKGLGFVHKSEAGAVRLGLASLSGQAEMPGATGYLAEEMATGGVAELLLGARRDPVYGATLTLGLGGVTAELMADTVTLVLPVRAEEVEGALRRLRLWPLLDGYRGRPRADVGAAVAAALALQGMLAEGPELEEIEINPLILRQEGAVAVDAVIRETEA